MLIVDKDSIEFIYQIRWSLTLYLCVLHPQEILGGLHPLLSHRNGPSHLPVGLSIELVGLDEDRPGLVCRVEEHQISWHSLSALHDHYVSYVQVFRSFLYSPCSRVNFLIYFLVHNLVSLMPLEIIVSLLCHRKHEDEGKRRQEGKEETDSERLKELGQRDAQKEEIEEELELIEEYDRDES